MFKVKKSILMAEQQSFFEPQNEIKQKLSPNKNKHLIKISYQTWDEDSAKNGEYSDIGWESEDGIEMDLDEYDIENGETIVTKTVKFLIGEGATEFSSSSFDPRGWYMWADVKRDKYSGEWRLQNYHLYGYTNEEKKEIYDLMANRNIKKNVSNKIKESKEEYKNKLIEKAISSKFISEEIEFFKNKKIENHQELLNPDKSPLEDRPLPEPVNDKKDGYYNEEDDYEEKEDATKLTGYIKQALKT